MRSGNFRASVFDNWPYPREKQVFSCFMTRGCFYYLGRVRLPPSHRNLKIRALSSLEMAFPRVGSRPLRKTVLGWNTSKRLLTGFIPQTGRGRIYVCKLSRVKVLSKGKSGTQKQEESVSCFGQLRRWSRPSRLDSSSRNKENPGSTIL